MAAFFLKEEIMSFVKRFFICLIALSVCSMSVFAVPGVESMVDFPGTFVYYRDYTYEDETYIGFLQYDAGTYALRYFSPQAQKGAKSIELYITCDTTKDTVEMTGEKIVGEINQIDVETLNYLHDLFYEFAARRKALKNFNKTVRSTEQYAQFGGEVLMTFEPYIPMFGVRSIVSADKSLFKLVYIGILNSGSEFTDFAGLIKPEEQKKKAVSIKKNKKAKKASLEKFEFTLDEQWTKDESQAAVQTWWLNDKNNETLAVASPYFVNFAPDEKYAAMQIELISLLSQPGSCVDMESVAISQNDKYIRIDANVAQEDKTVRSISTFYKISENEYFAFVVSADEQIFMKNEKYFKKIIDSVVQKKD